jgi:hypothetical protein
MVEDMVRLYFKHQKPPGAAFVERGDYRLVHGEVGNVIEPARWTYDVKPGHTVEMSMVLRKRNESSVTCPRCRTPFNGVAENGWADWKVSQGDMTELALIYFRSSSCLGRFQVETREEDEDSLVSPAR